ncbi:alanine racemase [Amycolatopsis arida]|uniref:Alanine racemase n=1 Tax=Amycolatopsis arida TaxID=587909 RepID=A0A1I5X1Q1_9PSEU|nr:alanine racemase [Amycolatopsis arida]TDX92555.1 alanine racemase [Amycolatopsis arida]SFQ25756.1 alanine racemase [Amycolatopsis arida]
MSTPTAHHPAPRAEVVIDLAAVRHNVALLAGRAAASGAATMAVVKADGYGHGALPVARAALAAGATWLGTSSLAEALELRAAGVTAPLLSWLDPPDVDFAPGVAEGVDLSASSTAELARIAGAAARAGTRARVHLKIDTGLCRNGCPPQRWAELVKTAAAEPDLDVVAVWSHLACADEPGHPSIDRQAERFADAYAQALDAGLRPMRHLANSAATLTRPDLHFDLVRPGIAVYGLNPVPQREDLRPAMTFRSTVVLTKRVVAGESVSYGHTWTAPRDTTLALVPVGYADGVPRTLSNRMDVWLAGRRRPIAGRVCMDQIVVDCGDDEPPEGSEVVLFGGGATGEPTATEWADVIGTIDYEIVTGMYRPRVRRRYLNEGGVDEGTAGGDAAG